jgi:tetratricopeptide (TPR) repeat protein
MKKLLFLTFLVSNYCIGQSLKFETQYYDAVDKWVAFDKEQSDSTYIFGFIYIDEYAGFTFNYESDFKITEKRLEKIPREMVGYMKTRLEPNTANVHILNDEEVKQLGLPEQPDWLIYYKSNEDEVSYLTRIGYHFNHVGASKNAIQPLLKAYNIEPHFKGLEFELAYAYNATKNFEKAIEILTKAIKNDPKDFWFLRELGFAYVNLGNLEKAEETYIKGIALSDNKNQKAEMAVNMAQGYFKTKNKLKFDEWAKITKQHTDEGSMFDKYINYWTENWDKQ